jgi:hypothetical protein
MSLLSRALKLRKLAAGQRRSGRQEQPDGPLKTLLAELIAARTCYDELSDEMTAVRKALEISGGDALLVTYKLVATRRVVVDEKVQALAESLLSSAQALTRTGGPSAENAGRSR